MILEQTHVVDLFDIAHDTTLRLDAAARLFQGIAVRHATKAGAGPDELFPEGKVWLLHRLELKIFSYPVLGDRIRVATWSRGFRHYMGLREYTIETDRGTAVEAASVWIFFDFKNKRVIRVPKEMAQGYQSEEQSRFQDELYQWQPPGAAAFDKTLEITLRRSDMDINGHVNNTVYPGFLETLFYAGNMAGAERISSFKLRYGREIPRARSQVLAGCRKNGEKNDFFIIGSPGEEICFADGEFSTSKEL